MLKFYRRYLASFASAIAIVAIVGSAAAGADFYKPFKLLMEPLEAMHRTPPATGEDSSIEHLANQIDWLEHYIDKYGSIVAKHPDIWGESRLMRHRYEYEQQMATQLDKFQVRMNAALRRSDQSFLGMAFALQAAMGTNADGTPIQAPEPSAVQNSLALVNSLIPDPNDEASEPERSIIRRTTPFQLGGTQGFAFEQKNLSLEPTVQLDQMSRYLNHLHELRRINEGDDIADSPGYALNLVRIPVSVMTGKQTRKGYGAEITISANPHLTPDLLPKTFRTLVINDLVDLLAPSLAHLVNNHDVQTELARYLESRRMVAEAQAKERAITKEYKKALSGLIDQSAVLSKDAKTILNEGVKHSRTLSPLSISPKNSGALPATIQSEIDRWERKAKPKADPWMNKLATAQNDLIVARNSLTASHEAAQQILASNPLVSQGAIPSHRSRRARLPLPRSQILTVFGADLIATIAGDAYKRLREHPNGQNVIHVMDVHTYLREEFHAAYDLLSGDAFAEYVWQQHYAGHHLANAIRERRINLVCDYRNEFLKDIGVDGPSSQTNVGLCEGKCNDRPFGICSTSTAALAWAVIVESSLLNQRLILDMQEVARAKHCGCSVETTISLYGPNPSDDVRAAFNEYVKCRWPIRVFALDPVSQDQNVADAFSRRRELQVAMALAFAGGQINGQALMRFSRRLEWDMATIQLNRTAIGFSHGSDTFGWRFFPRFQTPDTPGTVGAFGQTLFGGPSLDSDLRHRQLENGIRECTAIVVMPSFVPYMNFDIRTNWFKLTNPNRTELSMKDTVELSRSIKAMQTSSAACIQCAHLYRDGEVSRLLRRVEQLDRELPLQSMVTQIPYENNSGGFEVFNQGITDLAPELVGWYGSPGINPNATTVMYFVGDGFSVHGTHVIAGGRTVPYKLISRQLMEVQIPTGLQVLRRGAPGEEGQFDEVVDVHIATPYGVSGHLAVPVAKEGAALTSSPTEIAWIPGAKLKLSALVTTPKPMASPPVNDVSVSVDKFFTVNSPQLAIQFPLVSATPINPKFQIFIRDDVTNTDLGSFEIQGLAFDARSNEFHISANTLELFVNGSANAKTLASRIVPYLVWRQNHGGAPKTLNLSLHAALVSGEGRPRIPVSGRVEVQVDVDIK